MLPRIFADFHNRDRLRRQRCGSHREVDTETGAFTGYNLDNYDQPTKWAYRRDAISHSHSNNGQNKGMHHQITGYPFVLPNHSAGIELVSNSSCNTVIGFRS